MQRTSRLGRAVVAVAALFVEMEEEGCLSVAPAPVAAGPDTIIGKILRNHEVGSMADGLDMNGLWVHSHGQVTPGPDRFIGFGGLRADVVWRAFPGISTR